MGQAMEGGASPLGCTSGALGVPRKASPKARTIESALVAPTKERSAAVATRRMRSSPEGASPESSPE